MTEEPVRPFTWYILLTEDGKTVAKKLEEIDSNSRPKEKDEDTRIKPKS